MRAKEPLDLIHSGVCRKINEKSLSRAEYFVTFIDNKTRYVWVYVLKQKKQRIHTISGKEVDGGKINWTKVKTLRSENGGEYTSEEFESYLKMEGICHELTVPKSPEQNGVAEHMNRTLICTFNVG